MSELNITRQQVASANAHSPVGAELMAQVQGKRHNSSVVAVNKQSDLSDIQEEIGNSVGKLADRRTLERAKVRQGAGINKEALKRIADYYDKLPDAPREEKLRALVRTLEAFQEMLERGDGDRNLSADDILKALRDTDGDARRQYMLLQGARIHFEKTNGTRETIAALDTAERFFSESGIAQDVRADFAMLPLAKDALPGTGIRPQSLRDQYLQMLLGDVKLEQLFTVLSGYSKRRDFSKIVDLFLAAAGADLAATSFETDKNYLGGLLKQLGILKTLRSVFEASAGLLETAQRMFPGFGGEARTGGADELVAKLLGYCSQKTPSVEDARKIFIPFDTSEASPKANVFFGRGLLVLHRDLPDRVFPSDQSRLLQLNRLIAVCDSLVETEEHAHKADNAT